MVDIQQLIPQVNQWIKEILGPLYVGTYFHGSLRLGSFYPETSDLDFIIVVKDSLENSIKKKLCDRMIQYRDLFPRRGFEFSVVLLKYCQHFIYPTPYELHLSDMHLTAYQKDPLHLLHTKGKTDFDLASHFHVINIPYPSLDYGMPSSDVFAPIPMDLVIRSHLKDIQDMENNASKHPAYVILNLCRFYALVTKGLTLSKYQGGLWGLEHLDSTYHEIIQQALNETIHHVKTHEYSTILNHFMQDLKIRIHQNLSNHGTLIIGKKVEVTIDRPLGTFHPDHPETYYPINYGYIEGIMAPDHEWQDAYVLGIDRPVKTFDGQVIAMVHRDNDIEEKWIVAPSLGLYSREDIIKQISFQEKYFQFDVRM